MYAKSRIRLDQSDLAECTPTWARPRAISTEIVSRHVDSNFAEDFIDPPKNDKFLDGPTSGYCVEDY